MPYPWGSKTAIAELQGRAASDAPEAELWMGAHASAPARLIHEGAEYTLPDWIAKAPERALGTEVVQTFGPSLPFLLKVLAAAEPLSLQAHPSMELAKAGFDDEERRNVPRTAAHRNYKDRSHKPELLCALTPFDALVGFRRASDTLRLFDTLGVSALDGVLAPLRAFPDDRGLAETFRAIMTVPEAERAHLVDATVRACADRLAALEGTASADAASFAPPCRWAGRLAALYPGDVGIVSALLLNVVHLAPGEAVYLGAGNLHAYLDGVGVEIMASSDNVLRGGLTKKHVDVPELMRVLTFDNGPVSPLSARSLDDTESVYETPAAEFQLSVLRVRTPISRTTRGPEIVLCTEGNVRLQSTSEESIVELSKGMSAFISASTNRYALEGHGTLYRATVHLP